MQLLHPDKQTQRLPGDSSSADEAWAEILHPIPCAVQGPEFPDCCPRATGSGLQVCGGLRLRQEKGGVPFPLTSTSDLIPPLGTLGHRLGTALTVVHEITLTKFAQDTDYDARRGKEVSGL